MTEARIADSRRREWLGAVVGSLWLLACWWYAEPRVPAWIDEIFTSLTARQGVIGAFHHALSYQSQPPLYYVMAAIAWGVDPSIRALRAVSLLGALTCVLALIPLGRQLRLGAASGLLCVVSAGLPIVQAYAIEARPYTWSMALLTCYVSALLAMIHAESARRYRYSLAAVVFFATAAMLNFYFTGLVVAMTLVMAFVACPHRRRRVVVASASITALMLPWVSTIRRQLAVIAENYPAAFSGNSDVATWFEAWRIIYGGLLGAPVVHRSWFVAVVLVGLVVLITRTGIHWKHGGDAESGHVHGPDNASLAVVLIAGPGCLLVLLSLHAAGALMVLPRYVTILAPLVSAAAFALIQREPREVFRRSYWVGVLLIGVVLQVSARRNQEVRADVRPSAAFLASRATPLERVLSGNLHSTHLLLHAYRGQTPVIPLPVDTNTARYRTSDDVVQDAGRVAARIDSTLSGLSGFWWVRVPPPTVGVAQTDSIIRARAIDFEVVSDTLIAPLQITHFVRRTGR